VAWYDCGREVRQDGTKVGRFGAWDVVWIPRRIGLDISVVCRRLFGLIFGCEMNIDENFKQKE